MTRIFVTNEVEAAVSPIANQRFPSRTIVEGHDWPFFSLPAGSDPAWSGGPLRVGYTTWKSTIGDEVAAALAGDSRFSFEALRRPASWVELRDLYHRCDLWLCAPGPEEGFYLPGLEAMAADRVVVSALVGGNSAYLVPEENCLTAEFEDVPSHVAALTRIVENPALAAELRAGGHEATARHTLAREQGEFAEFVRELA